MALYLGRSPAHESNVVIALLATKILFKTNRILWIAIILSVCKMNDMPIELAPLPSNMASFRETKKCHQFRRAALNILANKGEMEANDLRRAMMEKMGVNIDGIFGNFNKVKFCLYFNSMMDALERDQSVVWEMKRSPEDIWDVEAKGLRRAHYSITNKGRVAGTGLINH